MEPSSGNRRRGRPRAFSEGELSGAEGRATLSRRQLQNGAYARRARRRLAELWEREGLSEDLPVPQCVLTELGRIGDEPKFREAAWWYRLYARGLTAKQAASKIKELRTGTAPQEGPTMLYERLVRTVEDFRVAYPDASLRYVERQIELALETVRYLRMHARGG